MQSVSKSTDRLLSLKKRGQSNTTRPYHEMIALIQTATLRLIIWSSSKIKHKNTTCLSVLIKKLTSGQGASLYLRLLFPLFAAPRHAVPPPCLPPNAARHTTTTPLPPAIPHFGPRLVLLLLPLPPFLRLAPEERRVIVLIVSHLYFLFVTLPLPLLELVLRAPGAKGERQEENQEQFRRHLIVTARLTASRFLVID